MVVNRGTKMAQRIDYQMCVYIQKASTDQLLEISQHRRGSSADHWGAPLLPSLFSTADTPTDEGIVCAEDPTILCSSLEGFGFGSFFGGGVLVEMCRTVQSYPVEQEWNWFHFGGHLEIYGP